METMETHERNGSDLVTIDEFDFNSWSLTHLIFSLYLFGKGVASSGEYGDRPGFDRFSFTNSVWHQSRANLASGHWPLGQFTAHA